MVTLNIPRWRRIFRFFAIESGQLLVHCGQALSTGSGFKNRQFGSELKM